MKRLRYITIILATLAFAICGVASADDGAIINKSMSQTITSSDSKTVFEDPTVNDALWEAEHAFTDMMGFYVPSQASNGLVGPIGYCDIDNQPAPGEDCAAPREVLEVAKPLVNVFIYGPSFHVEGTAFAHRWFDTYAAVSLDDGETWKKTNLSESADKSSFNLDTDHVKKSEMSLPSDHNILLGSKNNGAKHARGYEAPYTAHCTECHGPGLTGTQQAPSCYSCHGSRWKEEPFEGVGPLIYEAIYKNGKVMGSGENAASQSEVMIINGTTGEELWTTDATLMGDFFFNEKSTKPPCTVAAISDGDQGPSLLVRDKDGVPLQDLEGEACVGSPVDVTEYPGGSYNVFHATAGNKVLVAWPSRYCETGQPGYSLTTTSDTSSDGAVTVDEKRDLLNAIERLITQGDEALGVPELPDFTAPSFSEVGELDLSGVDDLYLVDAFGVAGSQGSVDFADEGYPQAGIVPFGCVWTARGVLLPGDDPRTGEDPDTDEIEPAVVEESHMVWTKAERLTSGRRDVNRIEVKAVKGAGFVITWQEDPDGLRPGQGLGPGEGWSGAVAHAQTDAWYSFINEEYFDIVKTATTVDDTEAESGTKVVWDPIPMDILDHDLAISGRPQVFVPMAVPMRLSNNAKCNAPDTTTDTEAEDDETNGSGIEDLYCVFDPTEDIPVAASAFGLKDQCADTVTISAGNEGEDDKGTVTVKEIEICVADSDGDGTADLPNRANTSVTRPRTSLQGYDKAVLDSEGAPVTDDEGNPVTDKSAWVIVAAEESKGLGKYFFRPDADGSDAEGFGFAEPCTADEAETDPTCTEEIGKNQWYFSFDMGTPDTSAGIGNTNSLVENLVSQGNMLNQPEVYWETGEFYGKMSTADMFDYGEEYVFDIVNTEIARRASILVQSIGKATESANGLLAITSWKQGTMRQGGPADTMLRRFVLPESFDPTVDNPYAFANMECEEFFIAPDTNPYYPGGVCADPAINLSGVVPDTCWDDDASASVTCPKVDFTTDSTYGIGDTNPILRGIVQGEGNTQRVLTWHQCPSEGVQTVGDITAVTCALDDRDDEFVNLRDQSWYNPLDISKGHRGFLDGDFVQFLYAWSPTWRLNAKGKDRYDLYIRRSFDGGQTWVTTPSSFIASDGLEYSGDGTVTCESYRPEPGDTTSGERAEPKVCYDFAPGVAEHARNVTQHRSMRTTTLDPRYAPTKATIKAGCTDGLFTDPSLIVDFDLIFTCDDGSEESELITDSDQRDPSRFFMVFETGDNTTVEVGEAEPQDLFYSRAENFGDDYVVWTETETLASDPLADCYPSNAYEVTNVAGTILEGSGFCNEFDNMNTAGNTHSSEANLEANPDGSKMYGVWAQWVFSEEDPEEVVESDAQARRVWWIDDYISVDYSYTLPGTSGGPDDDEITQ